MNVANESVLFSVGMCIYSGDNIQNVELAINSILNQTYKNFELIVHIDGVVDSAVDILIEDASKSGTVVIIKSPVSIGLAAGINKIIKVMTGEFFVRMDADDVSCPSRLEVYKKYFDDNLDVDIVGSAVSEFEDWPKIKRKIAYPLGHAAMRHMFLRRNPICHASSVYRRRVFDKVPGYPLLSFRNEDTLFFLSAFKAGLIFSNLPDCLYYVRFDASAARRRIALSKAYSDFLDRLRVIFDLGGGFLNVVMAAGILLVTVSPFYSLIRSFVLSSYVSKIDSKKGD